MTGRRVLRLLSAAFLAVLLSILGGVAYATLTYSGSSSVPYSPTSAPVVTATVSGAVSPGVCTVTMPTSASYSVSCTNTVYDVGTPFTLTLSVSGAAPGSSVMTSGASADTSCPASTVLDASGAGNVACNVTPSGAGTASFSFSVVGP